MKLAFGAPQPLPFRELRTGQPLPLGEPTGKDTTMLRRNKETDPCPPEIAKALGLPAGATIGDALEAIAGMQGDVGPHDTMPSEGTPMQNALARVELAEALRPLLAAAEEKPGDESQAEAQLRFLFGSKADAAIKKIREDAHLSDDAPMTQVHAALFQMVDERNALAAHAISKMTPAERRRIERTGINPTKYVAIKARVSLSAAEQKMLAEKRVDPAKYLETKAAMAARTRRT